MNRFYLIVLFFCSLTIFIGQAQDTLYLYTKHDCSVCKQTKQVFQGRGVGFVEKDVALSANASEMLHKLAVSGFKGSIYMPVIFLGNKLMHPAYSTANGLVAVEINAVVDSIWTKKISGKVVSLPVKAIAEVERNASITENADCEHVTGAFYLVVANYPNENEAMNAVRILLKNNYPNAGFVHNKGFYKVYTGLYPDFKTASAQLVVEKIKFTDATLLEAK